MLQYKCFIWCIMLTFSTCETNIVYRYSHKLADCKWHRDAPLQFNFDIQDTTQAYNIYLFINNTPGYPHQNFYFTYYLKDNSSALLATELKNYLLFEPKTGKPLGKGWTKNKSHEVIMIQNHYFVHPGTYTLELAQFMRTEILPGICTIGIKICKSNQIITQ
jgi:gliding motility-associated lipoprotein GldH